MYLTRFRLNTGRSGTHRLLASPHQMHGAVNMSFPTAPPREDGGGPRVLWRVDHAPAGRADLFIVSPQRPDLTHLVEQAGWPTLDEPGWTTYAYGDFLDRLTAGDTWSFRLTANPVQHIRKPSDPNTPRKRTAHLTLRHQVRWLLERQEKAGFEILRKPAGRRLLPGQKDDPGDEYEVIVHNKVPHQFRKGDAPRNAKTDVRLVRVTYDGRLRITDPDALRRTLTCGLGKAKAYGCGLMTLAPEQ
ncbi:type I-E CRISPR-associated protein Cas6/Cse3/CasE [Streptomyces albus]|uniref:type I-E CRISPR-associated protein Cas6/Cse3/CasE n=1 Tax=Streptomyces albus TaxID=1888 RepID=UPI0013B48275|nr:type I-E CRISPR-associated protein Cas6/Cse3/CasE [Streptomyces albus]QID35101.1 type I-E CRISPR-associated protein Cas6/Cse3/CasE [Streptomyces albus]